MLGFKEVTPPFLRLLDGLDASDLAVLGFKEFAPPFLRRRSARPSSDPFHVARRLEAVLLKRIKVRSPTTEDKFLSYWLADACSRATQRHERAEKEKQRAAALAKAEPPGKAYDGPARGACAWRWGRFSSLIVLPGSRGQ